MVHTPVVLILNILCVLSTIYLIGGKNMRLFFSEISEMCNELHITAYAVVCKI
jgi:hypothetical protein